MVAVPGDTPVSVPEPVPMAATDEFEEVHVPLPEPETVSVELEPAHVEPVPVMAPGCG